MLVVYNSETDDFEVEKVIYFQLLAEYNGKIENIFTRDDLEMQHSKRLSLKI